MFSKSLATVKAKEINCKSILISECLVVEWPWQKNSHVDLLTAMEKNAIKMVSVLDCRCSYFHILSIKK